MEDLNVVDSINGAGSWLVANQALLLSYAVNIVAALAIIIVGLIIARMISNAVNRLMISRKIDATVADFPFCISPLRYYRLYANRCTGARGRTNSDQSLLKLCRRFSCWSGFAGHCQLGRWRITCHVPPVPCR